MFERRLYDNIIEALTKEPLFKDKLLADIKSGNVFPAIRNNEIHFYYKGCRLFKYVNNKFMTNIAYANVLVTDTNGDITEKQLPQLQKQFIQSFDSGYEEIKKNCERYTKGEAKSVSNLYKYSYAKDKVNDHVILLDIEVSIESLDEDLFQDRIDFLLFNQKTESLKFYEAKLYSNPEIKCNPIPEVISQINRYNRQLQEKKSEIIDAYKNYINIVNKLFNLELKEPENIEQNIILFMSGFDELQKNSGKIIEPLIYSCKANEIDYFFIGNSNNITSIENLWEPRCHFHTIKIG